MEWKMPEVETKRLYLRAMELGDVSDLFDYYHDPKVMKYLSIPVHLHIDETLLYMKGNPLAYEQRCNPQAWVMVDKQSEKVIGDLQIHTMEDGIGEIGYMLHSAYWGQQLMQEALVELVKIGFEQFALRRIQALYAVEHLASGKVLQACGFQQEGILRKHSLLKDGKYHNMVLMAIVKEDIQ